MTRFFLSCLLAFTAGHMFNYTVILYLQEAVGSDWLSGLGFGLAFGSSIVFGWFAGVVCDRVPPHRVIHAAQALFLLGLACLAWAHGGASAAHRVAWVLVGAFCGGLAWSFVGPARLTALGQLAQAHILRPATIVFNLQVLIGFGLAPLLLGVVRSQAGWGGVLVLTAGGFVLSSLLLLGLRTSRSAQPSDQSVLSDMAEGFRAVGRDPLLAQLMLAAVLAYAMTGPLQILLPKLARDTLGLDEVQRGAYLGLLALALISGGVTALVLARRMRHGVVILGGVGTGGLVFALLSHITAPVLSAGALTCVGLVGGLVISLVVSGIQVHAPESLRGRIMGMYTITSQVVPALSGVAAGALASAVGVTQAIALAGLGLAGSVLVAALGMARLRRL